jgi:hypothetical protein
MTITQSGWPAMLGTARCSLPAMLETPDALSVPNRGGLREAIVKKELIASRPKVRNYTLTRNHRQSVSKSPVLLPLQHDP